MTIQRVVLINDKGDQISGSPLGNEWLQQVYDTIDAEIRSANYPAMTIKSLMDSVMAGIPFNFGGSMDMAVSDIAYPAGAAPMSAWDAPVLAPSTRIYRVDSALLQGTFNLEAILQSNNASYTTTLGLFNLTDSPNASPLVEITTTSVTGALVTSGAITFPAPGTSKDYGLKLKTNNAAGLAKAWGIRLVRSA